MSTWGLRQFLHHGGPSGSWGNLGLWPVSAGPHIDYALACLRLARRVGEAAGIVAGDRVLSIACGEGDELELWRREFHAEHAIGIDPDPGACARASAQGRSVIRGGIGQVPGDAFERVLCVDAAYHISPRSAFLRAARAALRPGGRLAFTDLVLAAPASAALRATARVCGIDARELLDPEAAMERLAAAGFTDIRCERLDEEVLGGFARFASLQAARLGPRRWHPAWLPAAITAGLIPPARARGLGYALFSASTAASAERTALSSKGIPGCA